MSKSYDVPILNLGAKWSETVTANNKLYRFHFAWNVNCKYWELSITDDYNILIVGGIRLVLNVNLVDEYRYLLGFDLFVLPLNDKREITLDNFHTDFQINMVVDEE